MKNFAFKLFIIDYEKQKSGAKEMMGFLNDKNTGEILNIQFKTYQSDQIAYYIIYEDLSQTSGRGKNE